MPSQSIGARDRSFLMSWKCDGPRQAGEDSQGEETWTLWRIHGKYTVSGSEDCYGAQYWENENGDNLVHSISVSELTKCYPDQVAQWEKKHGENWKVTYPNGNPWEPISSSSTVVKSSNPVDEVDHDIESITLSLRKSSHISSIVPDSQKDSDEEIPVALPQKRYLNDSPSKVRHPSFKRVKSIVEDVDMNDPIEDDDDNEVTATTPMQVDSSPVRPQLQRLADLKRPFSSNSQSSSRTQSSQRPVGSQRRAGSSFPRRAMSTKTRLAQEAYQARVNTAKAQVAAAPKSPVMGPISSSLAASPARFQTPAAMDMVQRRLSSIGTGAKELERQKQKTRLKLDAIVRNDEDTDDPIDDDDTSARDVAQVFADSQAEFEIVAATIDTKDAVPPAALAPVGVYNTYSHALVEAMDVGVESLVRVAMSMTGMPDDGWVKNRKNGNGYTSFISHLVLMLLGSDPLILKHFVKGDLPKEAATNSSLRGKLSVLRKEHSSQTRPTIYAQYLVNSNGISPTPRQLLDVLVVAERYINTRHGLDNAANIEAATIDNAIGRGNYPVSGKRRYFVDDKDHRVDVARTFLADLRARLAILPQDQPLDRPLIEVGYASKPTDRLLQHRTHSSSNYLMNFVEAIFRTRQGNFTIKQFVVLELVDVTHAMYAEILYSRIGLGYTKQGGGFSHHPAGVSHPGALDMPAAYWEDQQNKLFGSQMFRKNMEDELNRGHDRKGMYEGLEETADAQATIINMTIILKNPDFLDGQQRLADMMEEHEEEEEAFIALLDFNSDDL